MARNSKKPMDPTLKALMDLRLDRTPAEELGHALMQELCRPGKVSTATALKLIADGADLGFDEDGALSPLIRAANIGSKEIVSAVLAKGVDVNQRDRFGWTPLMVAAGNGRVDVARLLYKKGADLHAKGKKGETALKIAAEEGHPEVATALKAAERSRNKAETKAKRDFVRAIESVYTVQKSITVGRPLTFRTRTEEPAPS